MTRGEGDTLCVLERISVFAVLLALVAGLAFPTSVSADPTSGDLFYTRFATSAGDPGRVKKVSFSYDGVSTFTLGAPTTVATGIGADGIAATPTTPTRFSSAARRH